MNTETETERRSFLGIPVIGEIDTGSDDRVPQRPLSDLEPLIRDVLDDDEFYAFGWTQYTPYFNDGEPCVFRVHTPWFLTVLDVVTILQNAGRPTQRALPLDQAREVLKRAGIDPDGVLKAVEPEPEPEPIAVDRDRLPEFDELPHFDKDDYEIDYDAHPSLGKAEYKRAWVDGVWTATPVPNSYTGSSHKRYLAARALSDAINSGAFNDVLLDAFGDHCEVTVRRSGISVDSYEHD